MAFDEFAIWSWNKELCFGKVCGVILKRRE
jgi:hypothetical protein